jgi:hypothetical protein
MLKEKLDTAQSHCTGTSRDLLFIFQVEEIPPQFFLRNLVWGPAIILGQLAHSPHIGPLGI